jgi:hypothetical protein
MYSFKEMASILLAQTVMSADIFSNCFNLLAGARLF